MLSHFRQSWQMPLWFQGPATLRALIEELWNQRYPDLYEEDCSAPYGLRDAEARVLAACAEAPARASAVGMDGFDAMFRGRRDC